MSFQPISTVHKIKAISDKSLSHMHEDNHKLIQDMYQIDVLSLARGAEALYLHL